MRRALSPTVLFVWLLLLPSAALAALGWHANATLGDELRRTARDEALRVGRDVGQALPAAIGKETGRAAAALAAVAAEVTAALPIEPAGRVLQAGERRLGDGALVVIASDGAAIAPRGPAVLPGGESPEWSRFGAVAAEIARGGDRAAQAASAAKLQTPALRARALAACGGDEGVTLLLGCDGPTLAAAGPQTVEVLLGGEPGRARLRLLAAEGWLAAVPATEAARCRWLEALGGDAASQRAQRLRASAEAGGEVVAFEAELAGGARLRWLRERADVVARLDYWRATDVCEVGLRPASATAAAHWVDAATAAIAIGSAIGPIAIQVRHIGLEAVDADVSNRRLLYGSCIALLLTAVVAGALLTRRALAGERQAARLRDDFLANVSHELKTPLTSLRLHAEMLGDAGLQAHERQRYLDVALAEGARLSALVDDLLDFAALARGQRRLEPEPVDLAAVARRAAASWQPLCAREGVAFECTVDTEVAVLADPTALQRIVANLLQNALRHGRPARGGGAPRIRVLSGPGPRLEVRDNGPGVPVELRERIFARFERLGRGGKGLGLGLALSRDLATAMGGSLVCADDGAETVFLLTLPTLPADAVAGDCAEVTP